MTLTFFKQTDATWPIVSKWTTVPEILDLEFMEIDEQGWILLKVWTLKHPDGYIGVTHMEHVSANFGVSSQALGAKEVKSVWPRVPGQPKGEESAFSETSFAETPIAEETKEETKDV